MPIDTTKGIQKGYPDEVGKREIFSVSWTGPKSYTNTATFATSGEAFSGSILGFQRYVDLIFSAVSISGTYIVRGIPTATGARASWRLHWYTESSGTEVTNAVDLSAESVQIGGFCGKY